MGNQIAAGRTSFTLNVCGTNSLDVNFAGQANALISASMGVEIF